MTRQTAQPGQAPGLATLSGTTRRPHKTGFREPQERSERHVERDIRVGAAQFEPRDGDKTFNLGRIEELSGRARGQGAEIVSFHECSLTGYTFLRRLDRASLAMLAEPVPDGPSTRALTEIAHQHQVTV